MRISFLKWDGFLFSSLFFNEYLFRIDRNYHQLWWYHLWKQNLKVIASAKIILFGNQRVRINYDILIKFVTIGLGDSSWPTDNPEGEPVDDFESCDEAESDAGTEQPTHLGYEVHCCHPCSSDVLKACWRFKVNVQHPYVFIVCVIRWVALTLCWEKGYIILTCPFPMENMLHWLKKKVSIFLAYLRFDGNFIKGFKL